MSSKEVMKTLKKCIGFVVHKNRSDLVREYVSISDRITYISINLTEHTIQIYAPTSDYEAIHEQQILKNASAKKN